mmetsp:Transcript_40355/g.120391  ORF Transcript_40355/g.120391 Transcript_40355/m.120391 type:complete len:256 (+) Transcript_40355:409-1176(+)
MGVGSSMSSRSTSDLTGRGEAYRPAQPGVCVLVRDAAGGARTAMGVPVQRTSCCVAQAVRHDLHAACAARSQGVDGCTTGTGSMQAMQGSRLCRVSSPPFSKVQEPASVAAHRLRLQGWLALIPTAPPLMPAIGSRLLCRQSEAGALRPSRQSGRGVTRCLWRLPYPNPQSSSSHRRRRRAPSRLRGAAPSLADRRAGQSRCSRAGERGKAVPPTAGRMWSSDLLANLQGGGSAFRRAAAVLPTPSRRLKRAQVG